MYQPWKKKRLLFKNLPYFKIWKFTSLTVGDSGGTSDEKDFDFALVQSGFVFWNTKFVLMYQCVNELCVLLPERVPMVANGTFIMGSNCRKNIELNWSSKGCCFEFDIKSKDKFCFDVLKEIYKFLINTGKVMSLKKT